MIAKLSGVIDSLGPDWAVIDVGGVGYEVRVSIQTLGSIPAVGERCELWIHTHVREDIIALFGFASAAERHGIPVAQFDRLYEACFAEHRDRMAELHEHLDGLRASRDPR